MTNGVTARLCCVPGLVVVGLLALIFVLPFSNPSLALSAASDAHPDTTDRDGVRPMPAPGAAPVRVAATVPTEFTSRMLASGGAAKCTLVVGANAPEQEADTQAATIIQEPVKTNLTANTGCDISINYGDPETALPTGSKGIGVQGQPGTSETGPTEPPSPPEPDFNPPEDSVLDHIEIPVFGGPPPKPKPIDREIIIEFISSPPLTNDTVVGGVSASSKPVTINWESSEGDIEVIPSVFSDGAHYILLDEALRGQKLNFTVTDKGEKVSNRTLVLPDEPLYRVAVSPEGGIAGLTTKTVDMLLESVQPIMVGSNEAVGTGAQMVDKVSEMAAGALSSAVGGIFGGGSNTGGLFGGGVPGTVGSQDDDIKTVANPVPDTIKRVFSDPKTGTRIAVGAIMTPEGLQVSTEILESPDDGTFQAVYLQDPNGQRAGPTRFDIYELYRDWKLTVTWTYDRWVGKRNVEHRQGGWSESGRDILGNFAVPQGGNGIWSHLGFSTATKGIKSLGTFFPASPALLRGKDMNVVVHVTNPGKEIVDTTGFVATLPKTGWGSGGGAALVSPLH